MSIPLDRLYHYLDSLCNEDIIIYRWMPHGSKKLEDLKPLYFDHNVTFKAEHFAEFIASPSMIMHDQEPLYYYFYSEDEIFNYCSPRTFFGTPVNTDFTKKVSTRHLAAISSKHSIYDYTLLCHSEKNSEQLALYEKNNFIGVYYWAHALIARDWFRFAEHDLSLNFYHNKIKHDFLIYNRAWSGTREYRLKFAEMLIDAQIHNFCNVKFNPVDENLHYTNHVFQNKNFELQNKQLELSIPNNTSPSWYSADYTNSDYNECAIEVVLETMYDDTRNHLTEKTLRPIACGKPFMLASTPGSLSYLREYGFKTFNGLIDESYDNINDPVSRLQAIIKEMKRISKLNDTDKKILWKKLNNIAEYNKQHFFSDVFHTVVVDEFVTNFHSALTKCKTSKNKTWYNLFKSCKELQSSNDFETIINIVDSR